MSTPTSKVSFTVRRPTPISRPSSSGPESSEQFKVPALPRHLAFNNGSAAGSPLTGSPRTFSSREDSDTEDGIIFSRNDTASSDEDDEAAEDELVTGFDQFGVQRLHEKKKAPEQPLVIPSKPNPDWREAARKRRAASRVQSHASRATPSFIPDSARAAAGADGSVGGLGTRDTINSGPQLAGLQVAKRVKVDVEVQDKNVYVEEKEVTTTDEVKMEVEETEDERALRAILSGDNELSSTTSVDVIPVAAVTETDAFQQDVEALPDVSTAEDYARVPISAFGIAMLRGMGWTEGTVVSKSAKGKKSGLIEPYLPQARPALLGIGAKEREPDDDGSGKMKKQEKRYIPVVKKESRKEENGGSKSGSISRRSSRSPERREGDRRSSDRDRSRYDDRDRRRDEDRDHDSRRRRKEGRERERDYRKDRDDRDKDGRRERDRDYEDRRERAYNSERDRTRRRDREDAGGWREKDRRD